MKARTPQPRRRTSFTLWIWSFATRTTNAVRSSVRTSPNPAPAFSRARTAEDMNSVTRAREDAPRYRDFARSSDAAPRRPRETRVSIRGYILLSGYYFISRGPSRGRGTPHAVESP